MTPKATRTWGTAGKFLRYLLQRDGSCPADELREAIGLAHDEQYRRARRHLRDLGIETSHLRATRDRSGIITLSGGATLLAIAGYSGGEE